MSDFPIGGNVQATRAWLDRKGFLDVFLDWEADSLIGSEKTDILDICTTKGQDGLKLWGYLNTARVVSNGKFL
jgi:hypothetical protein